MMRIGRIKKDHGRKTVFQRRRAVLSASILIGVLLLDGFSFGEVRLKTDRPMIDLKETVQYSVIGDEDTMTDSEGQEETDPSETEEEKTAEIRIRETRIYLNGVLQSGPAPIRQQLLSGGTRVTLVDDYADYRTYLEVREMLRDASIPYHEEEIRDAS